MNVRDLAPAEWADFLEDFSRDHRGFLASVEHTTRDLATREIQKRPLVSMTLNAAGGDPAAIAVVLHPKENPQNTTRVEHPTGVRVHETDEGLPQHVEIEGERGEHLIVRLRGVVSPDTLLDGVAPGEVP